MAVYKCESWTFVPDNQELIYKGGTKEQLPTRLSTCLLTLISAQGETVSYDELLTKVWGTTHRDASTISSVISEVRKLIGCGQQGQKMIVTVPKRGYRFTHPIETINHTEKLNTELIPPSDIKTTEKVEQPQAPITSIEAKEELLTTTASLSSKLMKKSTLAWFISFSTLLALLFLNSGQLTDNSNTLDISTLDMRLSGEYEVLSHEDGREDEYDVSKDGRWLLYVNKASNKQPALIVKELTTGKRQTIYASGGYYFGSPVFSNDSKQIVFHKQSKQQCEVWLADFSNFTLNQNKTKKLTDCGKGGFWSTTGFSKDGYHVYFSRAHTLTDPFKIYRLDLRTGFERSITSPTSSGRGDYAFSISPSGEKLAVVRNVLWQETHILLNSATGDKSEPVIELPYLIDRVAWLSEKQLAWCDESDQIWSYDLLSKTRSLLVKTKLSCNYPVAASKQLYAIKKSQINNAVWQLNQNAEEQFIISPKISSRYYDFNAMFGPNHSLYFISNRSGEEKLWQQTEQGFQPRDDVKLPEHARELEFSAETNSFYGLAQKRLFRYDLSLGEIEWLSKEKHEVFNFSITDSGQLLFSEGKNEYWTLKSVDLYTLKMTNLNLNAFSAREADGQLYFTKFHEKGLWKQDQKTGDVKRLINDIDIKFVTFWDIWNKEKLIWANDNKFNIYDLNNGQLISDTLNFEGHVGYVKCNDQRAVCIFSFKENDETEIIRFKNITN